MSDSLSDPWKHFISDHSFSMFTHVHTRTHTRTCAYQGVRNVSFSKDFANVLHE